MLGKGEQEELLRLFGGGRRLSYRRDCCVLGSCTLGSCALETQLLREGERRALRPERFESRRRFAQREVGEPESARGPLDLALQRPTPLAPIAFRDQFGPEARRALVDDAGDGVAVDLDPESLGTVDRAGDLLGGPYVPAERMTLRSLVFGEPGREPADKPALAPISAPCRRR